MNDALIGSSGFVGGHLWRQHSFAIGYGSRTIEQSAGSAFDTVVCAAAPGSMFEANRFPDRDKARVDRLISHLSKIRAEKFVLISSVAVLADSAAHDDEQTGSFETKLAYGANRRALEVFCADRFNGCLIVRLPALFGSGLKKNFLFDILNPMPSMLAKGLWAELSQRVPEELRAGLSSLYSWDGDLEMFVIDREAYRRSEMRAAFDSAVIDLGMAAAGFTSPRSCFQYYDLSRLWADIQICTTAGISTIHLVPEPLEAGEIFQRLVGQPMPDTGARVRREDVWSRHMSLFGRTGPYIAGAVEVLDLLERFFATEKARA
jgi:hypothetical protein